MGTVLGYLRPYGRRVACGVAIKFTAAVLELSRKVVRCLSFNRRLCDLTLRSRRELLDLAAGDASALVEPQDWPGLLQELLDAARDNRDVDHAVRLRRKASPPLWVDLRAGIVSAQPGVTTFYAMLLDIDRQHRTLEQLQAIVNATSAGALYSLLEAALDADKTELAVRIGYWGEDDALRLQETVAQLREDRELTDTAPWAVYCYPSEEEVELIEFDLAAEFPEEPESTGEEPAPEEELPDEAAPEKEMLQEN